MTDTPDDPGPGYGPGYAQFAADLRRTPLNVRHYGNHDVAELLGWARHEQDAEVRGICSAEIERRREILAELPDDERAELSLGLPDPDAGQPA